MENNKREVKPWPSKITDRHVILIAHNDRFGVNIYFDKKNKDFFFPVLRDVGQLVCVRASSYRSIMDKISITLYRKSPAEGLRVVIKRGGKYRIGTIVGERDDYQAYSYPRRKHTIYKVDYKGVVSHERSGEIYIATPEDVSNLNRIIDEDIKMRIKLNRALSKLATMYRVSDENLERWLGKNKKK